MPTFYWKLRFVLNFILTGEFHLDYINIISTHQKYIKYIKDKKKQSLYLLLSWKMYKLKVKMTKISLIIRCLINYK